MNLYNAIIELKIESRILFIGSADEYGLVKEKDIPIGESHPLLPVNPYSISKASADFLSFFYFKNYSLNIIRVRPFNHIGPKQSPEFVASDFAKQIAEIEKGLREPIIKVGNLEAKRDFTDVRDMVRAYWLASQKGELGKVYNICSENVVYIKDLLNKLLSMSKKNVEIRKDFKKFRNLDIPLFLGDSTKFKKQTSWKQKFLFRKTLQDILNYWRNKIT